MTTETSSPDAKNGLTLGPDWLRSKPVAVFSKHRYGQEELLNLWTTVQCPQSITAIPDLAAPEPIKPACLSTFDEGQDTYHSRGMSSDRGRGRPSGRSRGGGIGRGGTRRDFSGSRYYETPRSADSDNWRRRDPDPAPQPDIPVPVPTNAAEQPPSYPPFPSKSLSPTRIDNRETNSWKRTEMEQAFSPPQAISPPRTVEPPSPARAGPLQFNQPSASEDSPETMLRNISQSLCDVEPPTKTESFNSHVLFSPFSDSQGGGGMFRNVSSPAADLSVPLPSSLSSQLSSQLSNVSTSGTTPTSPLDMPQFFNRDTISPQVSFPSSQPNSVPSSFPAATPPFPSLAEIGQSISNHVGGDLLRSQSFIPPPTPPQPQPSYRADEMWFYLDPKGNTQGPFDSVKMFGWFKEGYFGMDLKIRRSTDTQFTQLELLLKQCGRIPFQPEDKQTPPPAVTPTMTSSQIGHMTQPPAAVPAWTNNTSSSIWGSTETSSSFGLSDLLVAQDSEQVRRAEEIKKEIDRAVKLEQQRKLEKQKEEKQHMAQLESDKYLLAQQRQMLEAKMAEEQRQQEEQLRKMREEELLKSKLFEEEAEKIRLEKERLEQERIRQAEKVRLELEEAEKARQALEQERLKLEKERLLVKQKEEELRRRDEEERKRREEEVRVAEERRAAQKAAAEAKALAKAQEEATAAAIKEARRQAEEKARLEEQARREEQARQQEQARRAAAAEQAAAAKKREQENVWATRISQSPPAQENTNPWANLPQTNVTKAAARTPQPTTKSWAKPESVSIPLSQIQQDQAKLKRSAPTKTQVAEPVSRPTSWATQKQPTKTRSLAEIQKEEERRTSQQQNYNYAQSNSWNPVAGMLEEDSPPPRPAAKKQTKPPQKKQPQQQQPKSQNKKGKNNQPLLDMFSNSTPKDEFTIWCETQVSGFKNQHIDVPTFISFLRDVESPREVREYVVSYLGDTLSTDKFIQEFIAKRKGANNKGASITSQGANNNNSNNNNNKGGTQPAQQQPQTTSKRGKRKKMQKVNAASLLGINCTASSDARNRGDIDTVVIQ